MQDPQGVFTPEVISAFKSNSGSFSHLVGFVCASVDTAIAIPCGLKQLHRDPLEEVVSVLLEMNSRTIGLWRE